MEDKVVIVLSMEGEQLNVEMQFPEDAGWVDKKSNDKMVRLSKIFLNVLEKLEGEMSVIHREEK
jgi:hypothetical protein